MLFQATNCHDSHWTVDTWKILTCVWYRKHNKPKSTWKNSQIYIFSEITDFHSVKWIHSMGTLKENTIKQGGREKKRTKEKLGRVQSEGGQNYLKLYCRNGGSQLILRVKWDCITSWEKRDSQLQNDTLGKTQKQELYQLMRRTWRKCGWQEI